MKERRRGVLLSMSIIFLFCFLGSNHKEIIQAADIKIIEKKLKVELTEAWV